MQELSHADVFHVTVIAREMSVWDMCEGVLIAVSDTAGLRLGQGGTYSTCSIPI